MAAKRDLTGKTFGRMTVISESSKRGSSGAVFWHCRCDCGNLRELVGASLLSGNTVSCGCYQNDLKKLNPRHVTHGLSHTREYRLWNGMLQRCSNPNHTVYSYYGGRGISVCVRWISFECFLSDMGYAPTSKHSIERKDVNGNYEPSNCCWATQREQTRNTRSNRFITHNGETLTLVDWSERTGIIDSTIDQRLKRGWSISDALDTPVSGMTTVRLSRAT